MRFAYTWGSILVVVAASVTGDILVSLAMKKVGDLGHVYRERGLWSTVKAVLGNATLWSGVCFMALAFFSLLFALSWADVSMVAPASAALTYVGNALTAKMFLRENVDRRRWIAALLVAAGVVLVAG
jgi:drug/metabolite transporter (DMT)-like permease